MLTFVKITLKIIGVNCIALFLLIPVLAQKLVLFLASVALFGITVLIVILRKLALTVIHSIHLVVFLDLYSLGVMIVAKGGYFIIGYPCDDRHPLCIESFVSAIQDKGGEVAYILHDKDFKEDGTPAAPHYHVLCMWSSGVLPWSDFVDLLKLYNYRAFDMSHKGKTEEENKFCERVARVRDVDACLHYMTHEP